MCIVVVFRSSGCIYVIKCVLILSNVINEVVQILHRMIKFMLLFSRQGKVRLQKWFYSIGDKERKKIVRELVGIVLARKPKMSNFLDWKDFKVSAYILVSDKSVLLVFFM